MLTAKSGITQLITKRLRDWYSLHPVDSMLNHKKLTKQVSCIFQNVTYELTVTAEPYAFMETIIKNTQ
jgi:hypothetical protein